MKDATLSEKIMKIKSLLKEEVDIDKYVKSTNEGACEKNWPPISWCCHLNLYSRYNFPFRK